MIFIEAPVNDIKINVFLKKINLKNAHYLIPSETNFIYLDEQSKSKIFLLNNFHKLMTNEYLYFLELETIIGEGTINLMNSSLVKGQKVLAMNYSYFDLNSKLPITIETVNKKFAVKLKFHISKKQNHNFQMFKAYNSSQFELSSDLFPVYLYSYLGELSRLIFNVKLLEQENKKYNYSNLEIKGVLTNKESILSFMYNNTLNDSKDINVNVLEERELTLLYYDSIFLSSYDYFFIQINEITKIQNESHQLNFQVLTDTKIVNTQKLISLTPFKYLYSKIARFDNNTVFYILDLGERKSGINKKLKVEFASCSDKEFVLSFNYYSSNTIIKVEEPINEYGQLTYNILIEKEERFILLSLSLLSSLNREDTYYIIKYSLLDENQHFTQFKISKKLTYKYYPFNKTIESAWGNITNNSNYDSVVNSHFYYYLFDKGIKGTNFTSVCLINSSIKPIRTTNIFFLWTNESISNKGYINQVIGYFIDSNEEEYLMSFELIDIGISSGNLVIWVITIVLVFLILMFFGFYWVYKEISKREKEEKEEFPSSVEINNFIQKMEN